MANIGPDYAALVEPRLSTHQTRWIAFSSATRPFGMVNASPDTRIKGDWGCGYYYPDTSLQGFSHIHEWQIAALLMMPYTGSLPVAQGPAAWASDFSHDDEIAKPGYHRVVLQRYRITSELTATERVVLHRHTFPQNAQPSLALDLASTLGPSDMGQATLTSLSSTRLQGSVVNLPTVRRPKPLTVYFAIALEQPATLQVYCDDQLQPAATTYAGLKLRAALSFEKLTQPLVCKVAFSYTSAQAAWNNLQAETGDHFNFDAVRQDAHDLWNRWLSRVEVEGGTPEQQARFRTDLFFAFLGRRTMNDVSGTYIDNTGPAPIIRQIPLDASGKPKYRHFNTDSFWGAQWSITPLWSLACPEIIDEFCRCFMDMYRHGGLIPRGPAGGNYTFVMTSAQTTPFFVHALLSGIYQPENMQDVYQALRKNHLPGGLMSKAGYEHDTCGGGGLEAYMERGFIPEGLPGKGYHRNGAAQTLEHAYNDWALAQLAAHLGHKEDAALFTQRSKNYQNLFDAAIGFMRPRQQDGSFFPTYDPFTRQGWTEAGGWNYTFYVPHDVQGLIQCFGSEERFLAALEECFRLSESKGFVAPHDKHELTSLDFGNEPALGTVHLFHEAGKPERTQYWLPRIMRTLKGGNTPQSGYGGDEDQGMMGAWNALIAMGLFTAEGGCRPTPDFAISTPIFSKVTLHVPQTDGTSKDLVIEKRGQGIYIKSATFNGQKLDRLYLTRKQLGEGGTLVIETKTE